MGPTGVLNLSTIPKWLYAGAAVAQVYLYLFLLIFFLSHFVVIWCNFLVVSWLHTFWESFCSQVKSFVCGHFGSSLSSFCIVLWSFCIFFRRAYFTRGPEIDACFWPWSLRHFITCLFWHINNICFQTLCHFVSFVFVLSAFVVILYVFLAILYVWSFYICFWSCWASL